MGLVIVGVEEEEGGRLTRQELRFMDMAWCPTARWRQLCPFKMCLRASIESSL